MRPRALNYSTLDGLSAERDAVPWYWKMVAVASTFMILGGYLMLPTTFYSNTKELRVSQVAIGVFALALLCAGFSLTALSSFAVKNVYYRSEFVLLPSMVACFLGLLTVFYDFLVYNLYVWNTPALLTVIAAALSTVIYGIMLIITQRKIGLIRGNGANMPIATAPLAANEYRPVNNTLWQDSSYYENYVRNMFPASAHPNERPVQLVAPWNGTGVPVTAYQPGQAPADPVISITEEEMQRQQLLQLLLQRDPSPGVANPAGNGTLHSSSASTFHIDWQPRRDDDDDAQDDIHHLPPPHGYYAPPSASAAGIQPQQQQQMHGVQPPPVPSPAQQAHRQLLVRQLTTDLQPWDGVWRGPPRDAESQMRELREARRRAIENAGR